ncbi:hypothetical protein RchiOBHm_Chr2g0085461 [Rosa chinensis]|uniref:Uncharacterized protein n=1 Tax=Rosa chinensis TaxID=74649 RepID=A0A2P6RI67_ROSCH|nr:hypothetical protein RchiOBHm_Chr2g0085461 [Rosa chinensis]
MTRMKYALSLTLVLLFFSESLPSSAHESSLDPRSAVLGQKMQQPANNDLSVFHLNRKIGKIPYVLPKQPRPKAPRHASAAIPSQTPSLRLGQDLFTTSVSSVERTANYCYQLYLHSSSDRERVIKLTC